MRRVIRSLTYMDPREKLEAKINLGFSKIERLLNLTKTEKEVLEHIVDFFTASGEAPSFKLVFDHFDNLSRSEEVSFLTEAQAEQFYESASFKVLFEGIVEEQASQSAVSVLKEGIKIATVGVTMNGTLIKGTDAAVAHAFSALQGTPKEDSGRLKASMRQNSVKLDELYQQRKTNPLHTYGVMTGYGIFDQSTAGIRKKQFYLVAGFGGHLKSTLMHNHMLNAVVSGWNPLLFTSEEPAEDVQQKLIAMHSADPKFQSVGRPINSFRLLLGALRPEEEDFYQTVKDDLLNNTQHGNIRVIDSSEFSTWGSVMQRTVREHSEEEVDVLWCDYITRLPIDAKYLRMDVRAARNETLADAKRFAMGFNKGIGLPVCSPFQINRTGYKAAQANEGVMDKTALADYNAAEKEADVITYIFYDTEEMATSEPKAGIMKSRWGQVPSKPVSLFIEPDSRRIIDMSGGMNPQTGYAPTSGGADQVTL